ncbi:MAG: helix-turn-helix domain-containing protein [Nanoarchaeota archaeon]
MPLGNLTSQFFANIYLNELDHYIKEVLRAKYYIRYVDDFIILENQKIILENYKEKIKNFLKNNLGLELHPDKSKIYNLNRGTNFLGFRIFNDFKLVRKKNLRKFDRKLNKLKKLYDKGMIDRDYVIQVFEGWLAYVSHADTYKYRRYITRIFNKNFPTYKAFEVKNVKKNENFIKKTEEAGYIFTTQKTLQLLKKGLTIKQISEQRGIKIPTVWSHIANLIEYNQLSLWKTLTKDKILKILPHIHSLEDKLKDIKERIKDDSISYDEINCVLSYSKYENKKRKISNIINWYKKNYCFRKCLLNIEQRKKCSKKFDKFITENKDLEMNKKEFLELFNNHINICVLPEQEKIRYISFKEFMTKYKINKHVLKKII